MTAARTLHKCDDMLPSFRDKLRNTSADIQKLLKNISVYVTGKIRCKFEYVSKLYI